MREPAASGIVIKKQISISPSAVLSISDLPIHTVLFGDLEVGETYLSTEGCRVDVLE